MKKLMLLIIIGMFLISFTSATIDCSPHKINTTLEISFTDDIAGNCNITTLDLPNGSVIWINQEMTNTANTFTGSITNWNFTDLGDYHYNLICENGYGDECVEVTNNGEAISGSKIALSVVLLLVLITFFILGLLGFIRTEDYKSKFALYWVCHVLIIGITFIAWTTAGNYLSMDGGIVGMFKILFYFFTIASVPMLFLSLAWIFYIHTYNEHFQKLLEKGEDVETAFKLTDKKKRGWLHGK